MSYDIEYTRTAFYLPADTSNFHPSATEEEKRRYMDHFVFHKIGCNNISPRPKTWTLLSSGWPYQVIMKVCEYAGATEGGSLKFANGDTTPENYIKLYRKVLKDAELLTVEAVKEKVGIYAFKLFVDPKIALEAKERDVNLFRRLVALSVGGEGEYEPWTRHDQMELGMKIWTRPFNTVADLQAFATATDLVRSLGGFGHIQSEGNE